MRGEEGNRSRAVGLVSWLSELCPLYAEAMSGTTKGTWGLGVSPGSGSVCFGLGEVPVAVPLANSKGQRGSTDPRHKDERGSERRGGPSLGLWPRRGCFSGLHGQPRYCLRWWELCFWREEERRGIWCCIPVIQLTPNLQHLAIRLLWLSVTPGALGCPALCTGLFSTGGALVSLRTRGALAPPLSGQPTLC